MNLIWYNPDIKAYQFGDRGNYQKLISKSTYPERFTLVSKLANANQRIVDKIIDTLNSARPRR